MSDEMHRAGTSDEVRRLLEAYAAERLTPAPAAVARMRARVMREADALVSTRTDAAAPVPFRARRAAASPRGAAASPRRVAGALLAAALSVGVVAGSAAAATPGGPLYPVRVWAETLALPTDPDTRADAELGRLDARVGEALASAGAGDRAGLAASLAAFNGIVDEAIAGAGADEVRLARLEANLTRLRAVLERVLAQVPEPARDAVAGALAKTDQAAARIERIKQGVNPGNGNGPGGPGANPGGTVRPTRPPGPVATRPPRPLPTPRGQPSRAHTHNDDAPARSGSYGRDRP